MGAQSLKVTIKRTTKKKIGFEVELRDDGHYYITKIPVGHKCTAAVGDRVLEINGTPRSEFENVDHANELFETFRLEVALPEEDDVDDESESEEEDSGEEEDEVSASRIRLRNLPLEGVRNGHSILLELKCCQTVHSCCGIDC